MVSSALTVSVITWARSYMTKFVAGARYSASSGITPNRTFGRSSSPMTMKSSRFERLSTTWTG